MELMHLKFNQHTENQIRADLEEFNIVQTHQG